MVLSKFFRWLYNQNEPDRGEWITPRCVHGVRLLPRRERSLYKPSDIWNNEDCPQKRDRCYHSMANDTSARPHELLSLRIKDVIFKMSSTVHNMLRSIFWNKTKPRTLLFIFSVPYIKDWLDSHPFSTRQDAFLFPSLADSNFGEQLTENSYKQCTYKKRYFPSLLNDPSVPEPDKAYIRNLLTKPWDPYIQSALSARNMN